MPGKGSTHCDAANAFPESRGLLFNSAILSERSE
jgi:hypothetical protein